MLRELASASRAESSIEQFTSILCDRTLRAMSAEGVVVWESAPGASESSPNDSVQQFEAIARLGRITDRSISAHSTLHQSSSGQSLDSGEPSAAWSAHQMLLGTVVSDAEPVVVPSTPDVTQADVPANPTNVPAAIVPIDSGSGSISTVAQRVIEVFLEPGGGIATQRGYLRFICQVADLAGEYFRSEQLRTLLSQQSLAERCDQAIAQFHDQSRRDRLATLIVDQMADLFQLDRVALCHTDGQSKTRIITVSYVETIDQHSDSAKEIRRVAGENLGSDGVAWMVAQDEANGNTANGDTANVDEANGNKANGDESAVNLDALFSVSGVSAKAKQVDHGYRLTGFRLSGAASAPILDFEKRELVRTTRLALRQLQQIDHDGRSLIGRMFRRDPTAGRPAYHRIGRFMSLAVVAAVLVLVMVIPVPKSVQARATLRPENTQQICAVGDAVVETIDVVHGQSVVAGEVLMTLSDLHLQQQITTLVGRRAVLAEQKLSLNEDMVDSSASDFESFEKIQGQQSVVDEEIASVDQQLALLKEIEQSLTIRSDRDGVVDAWQIRKRLSGRPVQRGDSLLQVISHDSPWLVDAQVPGARIGGVLRAQQQNHLSAVVTFDDAPGELCQVSGWQFGPTRRQSQSANEDQVLTAITLTLQTKATGSRSDQSPHQMPGNSLPVIASRSGAPAKVVFQCGSVPLADLLVGDLCRDLRGQIALHWRWDENKGSDM